MGSRLYDFDWQKKKSKKVRRFFLACEFKPNSSLWSVLEPFAYDLTPAYIHGKLGIISYKPPTYSVVGTDPDDDPLVGYLMTITSPDAILLLDKIKGYYGKGAFNVHIRVVHPVFLDKDKSTTAWVYILSKYVVNAYSAIEQITGSWDQDKQLINLLEKLEKEP